MNGAGCPAQSSEQYSRPSQSFARQYWRFESGIGSPHPAHFGLDQALDAIAQFRPERAYLTHMNHEMEHDTINKLLPPNVQLAYDGLSFAF